MFHGLSVSVNPLKEGTFDEHAFINLLRPWSTLAWIHWAFWAQREVTPI
jgi:hypothetical protein